MLYISIRCDMLVIIKSKKVFSRSWLIRYIFVCFISRMLAGVMLELVECNAGVYYLICDSRKKIECGVGLARPPCARLGLASASRCADTSLTVFANVYRCLEGDMNIRNGC